MLRLLWNTKQFKWARKSNTLISAIDNTGKEYSLEFKGSKSTIYLRTHTGDLAIFYEIFWNQVYQLPHEYFANAKTIVDLGANIGLATLYFRYHAPGAVIYSVEPEKSNYKVLLKNLDDGIRKQQIIPLNEAIDIKNGQSSIYARGMLYNATIGGDHATDQPVKTITMDTLLSRFSIEKIEVLKMDIEGTEQKLFEGNVDWLDKVRCLLIEFHSSEIKNFCTQVLVSKQFEMRPIKTGNGNSHLFWAVNMHV